MSRGGARSRGQIYAHNTSGLPGIGFAWFQRKKGRRLVGKPTLHVRVAVGDRRLARSADANGDLEALRQAIQLRADAGLPVPTLRKAASALRAFRAEGRK